jgi:hypothetical protein
MRLVGALILVGACLPDPGTSDGYPPSTYDPGTSNPSNTGCMQDSDCGSNGDVCARDFSCVSPGDVYTAHISWTIGGMPATTAACMSLPDLDLEFHTTDDYWFGFSPVACDQGKFTIDKLPTWYVEATLGPEGDGGTTARIDPTTGIATIDLPF